MPNNSISALSATALVFAAPAVCWAQDGAPRGPASATLAGGPIDSPDRVGLRGDSDVEPDIQLSNKDENISADFEVAFALAGAPTEHEERGIRYVSGSFWSGSIKAHVPLGEGKAPEVDFRNFGIDGSLSLSLNHYSSRFALSQDLDRFTRPMARQCALHAGGKWISDNAVVVDEQALGAELARFTEQYQRRLDKEAIRPWEDFLVPWDDYNTEVANDSFKPSEDFRKVYDALVSECRAGSATSPIGNSRDIIYYFRDNFPSDQAYMDYRDAVKPDKASFFGVEGSVGLSRFNLLDRASFDVVGEDEIGFDLNAHMGWFLNGADTAFRIGGGYTRTFEAQDEIKLCRPLGTGDEQECIEGEDGAPVREDTAYLEVGIRHIIDRDRAGNPRIAIAPSVTYIVEDEDFQFEVPLYLQRSEKNGLDAGLRATYNTGEDDVAFGVFIGVPFNQVTR